MLTSLYFITLEVHRQTHIVFFFFFTFIKLISSGFSNWEASWGLFHKGLGDRSTLETRYVFMKVENLELSVAKSSVFALGSRGGLFCLVTSLVVVRVAATCLASNNGFPYERWPNVDLG